jgi:FkbM family methyltransferase
MQYILNLSTFLKRTALIWLPPALLTFLKKIYYARDLRSFSKEQEPDLKLLEYFVKQGDSVIDIGANYGIYTKALSQLVGSKGHVYSVEPVPATFEILCSNVQKLGLKNIDALNCAISDVNGTVTIEIPSYSTGGENYYQAHIVKNDDTQPGMKWVHVPSFTIDFKFNSIADKISFIKCDVEGFELECLRGAENLLKINKPGWLIEISEDPNNLQSSAHQVFKLLSEKGYNAWWFDNKFLRRWQLGDNSINFFFLTDEHISSLREHAPHLLV